MPGQDDAEYFVEIMQVVETCKVSIEKEKKKADIINHDWELRAGVNNSIICKNVN